MEKAKIGAATLIGALSAWWGESWVLILLVACAVVFDYVTGVVAAGREHEINSKKMTDGIYKKVGLLCLLALGFGLDAALTYFASAGLGLELPFELPFGLIVCAWIVINESISVTENLVRLDVPVPGWLTKFLRIAKDRLDAESPGGAE